MLNSANDFDYIVKIVLIGDSGVGKTSLLGQYLDSTFNSNYVSTIGIDFKIQEIQVNGKRIKLQLFDSAGQERFRSITTSYYRGAHAIITAFSVDDPESFDNIRKTWRDDIKRYASEDVAIYLVATKCDKKSQISQDDIDSFVRETGWKFIQTSALKNYHLTELFEAISRDFVHSRLALESMSRKDAIARGLDVSKPETSTTSSCFPCF